MLKTYSSPCTGVGTEKIPLARALVLKKLVYLRISHHFIENFFSNELKIKYG